MLNLYLGGLGGIDSGSKKNGQQGTSIANVAFSIAAVENHAAKVKAAWTSPLLHSMAHHRTWTWPQRMPLETLQCRTNANPASVAERCGHTPTLDLYQLARGDREFCHLTADNRRSQQQQRRVEQTGGEESPPSSTDDDSKLPHQVKRCGEFRTHTFLFLNTKYRD